MKRSGLLPPEVEDKAIQEYVNSVAQRIAQKSDLKIPLHVSVLQSREINAFALAGRISCSSSEVCSKPPTMNRNWLESSRMKWHTTRRATPTS